MVLRFAKFNAYWPDRRYDGRESETDTSILLLSDEGFSAWANLGRRSSFVPERPFHFCLDLLCYIRWKRWRNRGKLGKLGGKVFWKYPPLKQSPRPNVCSLFCSFLAHNWFPISTGARAQELATKGASALADGGWRASLQNEPPQEINGARQAMFTNSATFSCGGEGGISQNYLLPTEFRTWMNLTEKSVFTLLLGRHRR